MMAAIHDSRRARPSPWTQPPRGAGESDPEPSVSAEPSSPAASPAISEDPAGDSAAGKRQAWNKHPPNGASEVGPVMGAESWPALGEAARVSTKSSSESLKGLSDTVAPSSLSQVSVTQVPTTISSPRKQPNSTSAPNHPAPLRQKSMKNKNNNSNPSSNGGLPQQQELPGQVVENSSNTPSPRDHTPRGGFGSHSHGGGDPQQRFRHKNSSGGSGPHPRGDGSHHQNYGGRRDQERGNHEWNFHSRSFNGRDSHPQQQRVMSRPMRGPPAPPSPPPFYPHHGIRQPYGPPQPMAYSEMAPPVIYFPHYVGVGPVPPLILPAVPDHQLYAKIANQIDYYFSNENLVKDEYLRKKMNKDGGWISVEVIKRFQKVRDLTDSNLVILEALRFAKNVEVQAELIRKRDDWKRWIIIPTDTVNVNVSSSRSDDNLAALAQSIRLEEQSGSSSSSGQSYYQPQISNGDAGADSSSSGRN